MAQIIYYDVFISHAYEDKNVFTNELAIALKEEGLKIWYSGFELKLGDSITDSVNNALKGAEYGIVVISPIYLEKQWAMSELKALFTQEAERNRILPILHNITMDEIKEQLPMLADRYAISSDKGLEFIVNKVMEVITGRREDSQETNGDSEIARNKNGDHKNYISEYGSITLGGAMNMYGGNGSRNTIQNKNKAKTSLLKSSYHGTNNHAGKRIGTFVFLLIMLIAVVLGMRSCNSSAIHQSPPINKNYGSPSNSE
jgi:hypothetical protein